MDRNSAIGLTLIAALLLIYFTWFAPKPEDLPQGSPTEEIESLTPNNDASSLPVDAIVAQPALIDSLNALNEGKEELKTVETNDLKITFSTKGGVIQQLELKNYKTYHGNPLVLVQRDFNTMKLNTQFRGRAIDLYSFFYSVSETKNADTTQLRFTVTLSENISWTQTYSIPETGYKIGYGVNVDGGTTEFAEQLTLEWNNVLLPLEKDINDSRNNTTITYYQNGSFDELSQRSTDTEREVLSGNLNWVSIKQKFFLASIISENGFPGGEVETNVNVSDPSVVKRAQVKISIPMKDITEGKANYAFYFGPNDYKELGKVTESFAKNVYLGWPPVYWINKFVVFPVFHFLTNTVGNFGLIIIILVIVLRIILLPLSYTSYLSMAKMRLLKPELDEIKEKIGDDMTKMQQEQMKLYQQAGVNPLSGCIPLVLQMPFLFAMFYLFPNSIELRQQSFLWAEDLSTYDSILNLPFTIPFYGDHVSLFTILMTVSTLVYTWQNNQLSSVQGPMKSMSYMMPVIFLFVLNSFPSGLSFYYFVTNLVTFAQQAIIKRFVNEDKIKAVMENHRKMMASGNVKKSRFMSKLEDAMKASEESRKQAEEARKKRKKN
ncbi:MAG: membrane protein insertase YidC [Cyclobacteriaceae bacterium]|nr:membrane protein insertase YidC [Cyclobacteriaceae bacterium]